MGRKAAKRREGDKKSREIESRREGIGVLEGGYWLNEKQESGFYEGKRAQKKQFVRNGLLGREQLDL